MHLQMRIGAPFVVCGVGSGRSCIVCCLVYVVVDERMKKKINTIACNNQQSHVLADFE